MGRKNLIFNWTELGAKHIGIMQNSIVTCRLHDIGRYDYLVVVLQRVAPKPATKVYELTPRLWKIHFASNALRPDLYNIMTRCNHAAV
jgi:transposase